LEVLEIQKLVSKSNSKFHPKQRKKLGLKIPLEIKKLNNTS